MKERLEEELLNSLDVVKEYLKSGASLVEREAPLIIEELVRFNLYYSGFIIGLFLFSLVATVISTYILFQNRIDHRGKDNEAWHLSFFVGGLATFVTFLLSCFNVKTFIMCLTAPRLFVIEYLGRLL
jgi:MFS family permease